MIAPEKMMVLWNSDDKLQITELVVVDRDKHTRRHDRLDASAGACDHGWLEDGFINTPPGLFAYLAVAYGFRDRHHAMTCLREFGKVEGQAWVQEILRALGAEVEEAA